MTSKVPYCQVRNRQAGLSLIELMVSMVIISIAIAAAMSLGYASLNSYRVHRTMGKVERSARISLELMADALRNASPGVPNGNIEDLVGCSTTTFATNNMRSIQMINSDSAPDQLDVIHASGGVLGSLTEDFDAESTQLKVVDDLAGSEFQPGDYAVITNLNRGYLIPIFKVEPGATPGDPDILTVGHYKDVSKKPNDLCTNMTPWQGPFVAGVSLVIRARWSSFYIEISPNVGNIPTLMLDPDGDGPKPGQPIAAGVEDLQIAVGIDADSDGVVNEDGTTADEWFFNAAGDIDPINLAPQVTPRAFRVNLVARSVLESSSTPVSTRPGMEDRSAATTPDEFRRRVLSATVEIRNLDGSP